MISGRVLKSEIDQNGNIDVSTEYTLTDGSKQTGHTRYSCFNFKQENVLADVKAQCENLMRKTYNLKQNQKLIKDAVLDVTYECSSVEHVVKPEVKDAEGNITQAKESITLDDSDPVETPA